MIDIPQLSDIDKDLGSVAGKYALVRCAFNVPISENGEIEDDFRIQKTLPTIEWLTARGARVILISHRSSEGGSLESVYEYLSKRIKLSFIREYVNVQAQGQIEEMADGDIVLFENLRLHNGEVANNPEFSEMLAGYADFYINESFDVAHREQASVVGVPKLLPSYAGLRFVREIEHLSRAFNPAHPFLFIIGGVKFATKLPLAEKFLGIADKVAVGGAVANVYLKEAGYPVGNSLLPDEAFSLTGEDNDKLVLPSDVVVRQEDGREIKGLNDVLEDDSIRDVGPATIELIRELSREAEFVLWNGPLGDYEHGFDAATKAVANILAEEQKQGTQTIIGGGDTGTILHRSGHTSEDFTFVSIAGGAMLQFLANETLPGIEALQS